MIADIVTFGGGGYVYEEVRRMPVHIRKFIYNRLVEQRKKQNENPNELTADNVTKEKMIAGNVQPKLDGAYIVHPKK